jgi:hypothetical protein
MNQLNDRIIEDCKRIFELPDNVSIYLNISQIEMMKCSGNPNALGGCGGTNATNPITVVVLDDMPILQKLQTLCHEIVHVHQIVHGRLTPSDDKNKLYFDAMEISLRDVSYTDLPWEIYPDSYH